VGIDAEQGFFLLGQILKAKNKGTVFQHIRGIARVKSVAVTQHG
jgi:hypothetical protein